ncbi:hypothetical protein E1286_04740 [Nonomuraea terrae]|uniref:Uncharacterized protein n=1 Tax=Nonomuraea terrae TaxID=2530383 RepID=A0A4V6PE30_9ACTN|nr:hypothetical protein [Nonomuraea terrae]TDD55007.1 hypothetical protein E1286_04740 [Nonomuraea terrae]
MVHLNPALVGEMVAAALAAHDTVITYTERNLRQMWEDTRFREGIERRIREQLLGKVVEQGVRACGAAHADVPLLRRTGLVAVARHAGSARPAGTGGVGAPWEWVEVELSVPARRVGSLEQRAATPPTASVVSLQSAPSRNQPARPSPSGSTSLKNLRREHP